MWIYSWKITYKLLWCNEDTEYAYVMSEYNGKID